MTLCNVCAARADRSKAVHPYAVTFACDYAVTFSCDEDDTQFDSAWRIDLCADCARRIKEYIGEIMSRLGEGRTP